MKHLLPGIVAIALCAAPAPAQDVPAILAEAESIALPITDLNDWARAVEMIAGERAAQGDIDHALALLTAAPDPSVLGSLNIAIVNGALDGLGGDVGAKLADGIADPAIRSLAQADVVAHLAQSGDRTATLAAYARMDPAAGGAFFAVDDVVSALIADDDRPAAMDFAVGLTDPEQRGYALLWIAFDALEQSNPDTALSILAQMPATDDRDILAMRLVGGLAQAGRLPEAEVMLASLTDPIDRDRAIGELAAHLARQGDLAGALARLDAIALDAARDFERMNLADLLLRSGDQVGAQQLVDGIEAPDRRAVAQDRLTVTMAELGDMDTALARIAAMTDDRARGRTIVALIRILVRADDLAPARAFLPQLTDPVRRSEALIALIRAGADSEGTLWPEALAIARGNPDPSDRARALVAVVTALRQGAD